MEEYKPVDYKIEKTNQPKSNVPISKESKFKFGFRDLLYFTVIAIQSIILLQINSRLSLVEGAFETQIEKYQKKLDALEAYEEKFNANEKAIKRIEEGQKNKNNK